MANLVVTLAVGDLDWHSRFFRMKETRWQNFRQWPNPTDRLLQHEFEVQTYQTSWKPTFLKTSITTRTHTVEPVLLHLFIANWVCAVASYYRMCIDIRWGILCIAGFCELIADDQKIILSSCMVELSLFRLAFRWVIAYSNVRNHGILYKPLYNHLALLIHLVICYITSTIFYFIP